MVLSWPEKSFHIVTPFFMSTQAGVTTLIHDDTRSVVGCCWYRLSKLSPVFLCLQFLVVENWKFSRKSIYSNSCLKARYDLPFI